MSLISTSVSTVGEPTGVEVSPHGHWSGYNGSAGFYQAFAPTLNKGYMKWSCADNVGNFAINWINASFAQACTITVPDPGAGAANLVLDTGILDAGVGASSPGSLTGVTKTLRVVRGGVTYYIPLYAVNT